MRVRRLERSIRGAAAAPEKAFRGQFPILRLRRNASPAPLALLRKASWSSAAKRVKPFRLERSVKFSSVAPA